MEFQFARKMIKNINEKHNISLNTYNEQDIDNNEILDIIKNTESFKRSQIWGDHKIGKPIEYHKLIIIEDDVKKTFEFFNLGMFYIFNESDELKNIFRVFSHFSSLKES